MKILVGFDGSPAAIDAVTGLSSAGLPERGEALVVAVHEAPSRGTTPLTPLDGAPSSGLAMHDDASRQATATGRAIEVASRGAALLRRTLPGWLVVPDAVAGSAATALLGLCERERPDLLVLGAHGGSAFAGFFLGSVAMKLATAAPCAVRIARRHSPAMAPHLLLAHDGAEAGDALVAEVAARSFPCGTRVKVVTVHEPLLQIGHTGFTNAALASYVEELNREDVSRRFAAVRRAAEVLVAARLDAVFGVVTGSPVPLLADEARAFSADTIFVGARGLGPLERVLLGSVSAGLALAAPCSVEIHRAGARETPAAESPAATEELAGSAR